MLAHRHLDTASEPYFNNDETRHVMTGVFIRDALADGGWKQPRSYATRYYLQYPSLGLLVWPPFFYLMEAGMMFLFGITFDVALLTVALFALLAAYYFFRLLLTNYHPYLSALGLCVLGFSPLIFNYTRQVMLEIPTLALLLGSIFHFERYLQGSRRGDAFAACFLAALSALTRFDAVVLLPYFFIRLTFCGKIHVLMRKHLLIFIGLALAMTGPYYWLTWTEYGSALGKAVQPGNKTDSPSFMAIRNLVYFPSVIPEQMGWPVTIFALLGLSGLWNASGRQRIGPMAGMILATYLTFTLMAEQEVRHAIYWTPALVILAMEGVIVVSRLLISDRSYLVQIAIEFLIVGATYTTTAMTPHLWLNGYERAARYVLEHGQENRLCVMDGLLNGNFIYQIRSHDPSGRMVIVRGDKLFYGMLSIPQADYQQWVHGEEGVLELLDRYDPEFIVVEEPQIFFELSGATLLRETLQHHPQQFRLEISIPILTNHFRFQNVHLLIYRKLQRNPNRSDRVEYEMLNLRRTLREESR